MNVKATDNGSFYKRHQKLVRIHNLVQIFFGFAQFDLKFPKHFIFLALIEHQVIVRQLGKFLFELTFLLIPVPFYFCGVHLS